MNARRQPQPKKSRRPGVPCPHCANAMSSVTRTTQRGNALQRIRRCLKCQQPFVTKETTAKSDTGVTDLATGVVSLIRALDLSPKSYLCPDPVR